MQRRKKKMEMEMDGADEEERRDNEKYQEKVLRVRRCGVLKLLK